MELAERVKYARERRGLSQRKLAIIAGLSPTYICVFEAQNGHIGSPTLPTIEKIAFALGVSPEWLAFEVGNEPDWDSWIGAA